MISIIICSRSGSLNPALKKNIQDTIGVTHEVILIDNSANNYSIFQAYNKGVGQSKYPFLCFMHDDINYHTDNWGGKVLSHFEDEETGAIGIAGSPYAPSMPGSWWAGGLVNEYIIPRDAITTVPSIKSVSGNKTGKNQVVVIDGVWMCLRKSLFDKISFDETRFEGFHFYDIDISLQINNLDYKLQAVFDILIKHFSETNMNRLWLKNAMLLQEKWEQQLPVKCLALRYAKRCETELKTFNEYLDVALIDGLPKKNAYWLMIKQMFKFRRGYFYYRTPLYFLKFARKILLWNHAV